MEPHQPIPNLVVKRVKGDNIEGEALWEDNLMPGNECFIVILILKNIVFKNRLFVIIVKNIVFNKKNNNRKRYYSLIAFGRTRTDTSCEHQFLKLARLPFRHKGY